LLRGRGWDRDFAFADKEAITLLPVFSFNEPHWHPMAGLPDGIFLNQKTKFGKILGGLAMKVVGIFYSNMFYFTATWPTLWPFRIFCGYLVCCKNKNLATLPHCVRQIPN
jgi:hypothetical protein